MNTTRGILTTDPGGATIIRRNLPLSLAIAALLFVALWAVHFQEKASTFEVSAASSSIDTEESDFLFLINDYRRENGLDPLSLSPTLTTAAHDHSLDMAQNNYFSHTSADGRTLLDRVIAAGYTYRTALAENLAVGYSRAPDVFAAWKNSVSHSVNMLFGAFKVIGIGSVANGPYSKYWTTDFGGFDDSVAKRLWGATSADTAVEISRSGWASQSSKVAIIARDDFFTDALAGGPLAAFVAKKYGTPAPILLTSPSNIAEQTKQEIGRLGAEDIYLLGGPGALGPQVELAVKTIPGVNQVRRLMGDTAYGTAGAIKNEMDRVARETGTAAPKTAIITTGENFPDALVVSGPAASKQMPILLVKPFTGEPPDETKRALAGVQKVIIVGGPGAVHPSLEQWLSASGRTIVTRLWGESQYDTQIAVLVQGESVFGFVRDTALIVRGDHFTDALSGGAFSARGPYPMLLVRPDSVPAQTTLWLTENSAEIKTIYILGGRGAVSDKVVAEIVGIVF